MIARTIGAVILMVAASVSPPAGAEPNVEPNVHSDIEPNGGDNEVRPSPAVLRLSEADVLAGFTPQVRSQRVLRDQALALWRTHFAAQAESIVGSFKSDADWRPALADAAALVDDFLEASLLPRARTWPAGPGTVWIETLDPATGRRTRLAQPEQRRRTILAPKERAPKLDDYKGAQKGLKINAKPVPDL